MMSNGVVNRVPEANQPCHCAALTAPQMKKRYSSAKPYGEWLAQELVTLDAIVRSVPERGECGALPLGMARHGVVV